MPETEAAKILETTRVVAEHWRETMVKLGEQYSHLRGMAHPLCCVLYALDGYSEPANLGIEPGPVADKIREIWQS